MRNDLDVFLFTTTKFMLSPYAVPFESLRQSGDQQLIPV